MLRALDESDGELVLDGELDVDATDEESEDEERVLRCAQCDHSVTRAAQRIARDGRHIHVFTNPHGFVFQIACFRNAPGAAAIGVPSDEWAWFAGTTWRTAICRGCSAHLGWSFEGAESAFWALITAKLY